ncbi:hypothetical protein F2Q69_00058497 [Brassica cretica]|uniref:Uncharacterized protein n=1 Tax=Brassica cretica TaxID=69181 RepID=A0A8S9RRB1_BRACR|nr:hypothetical protein F2Q69_00058497 [Brassica cretica]
MKQEQVQSNPEGRSYEDGTKAGRLIQLAERASLMACSIQLARSASWSVNPVQLEDISGEDSDVDFVVTDFDPNTRSEAPKEARFEDSTEARKGLMQRILQLEIKLLGDRMAAVEKKVESSKKATASNDLQLCTESPPKCGHEPEVSSKTSPKITEKRVTRQSARN